MLKLQRIKNLDVIRGLLLKDTLYKNLLGVDELEQYTPNIETEGYYVGIENDKLLGLCIIQDVGRKLCSLHIGLYKEHRNKQSPRYFKQALKKFKRLVYPYHIVTQVREDNPAAWKLCEKFMKEKKPVTINNIKYKIYLE